ncbi:MAG: flagellar protein FlaG [Gammaproteobacteria bacterium]|jgi:flagellar protein FlaG|nr:flagellar protein FlaG [Gammaproteobacteria bacterium]
MDSSLNIRDAARQASAPGRPDGAAAGKPLPREGEKLPPAEREAPTPERVAQAVQQIQSYLSDSQRQLQFQVDADSGRTIVRVVNPETKEVIRQIPGDEVLKLARAVGSNGGRLFSDLA